MNHLVDAIYDYIREWEYDGRISTIKWIHDNCVITIHTTLGMATNVMVMDVNTKKIHCINSWAYQRNMHWKTLSKDDIEVFLFENMIDK